MAKITIEIDTTLDETVEAISDAISGVLGLLPHGFVIFTDNSTVEVVAPADEPSYVVRIGVYSYLAEPAEVGIAQVGWYADVEARNGGHWQGKITEIQSVDDFEEYEGDLPSLKVLAVSQTRF